jgi:hypothetical protein
VATIRMATPTMPNERHALAALTARCALHVAPTDLPEAGSGQRQGAHPACIPMHAPMRYSRRIAAPAHTPAATSHNMPSPSRRDLRKHVRKLGAVTRPGEQRQALATLAQLVHNEDNLIAIADAGAIPDLVQLLGPGSSDDLNGSASGALWGLATARYAGNRIAIAAAGGIPPLVQLLGPGSTARTQSAAAGALWGLSVVAANKVTIAAAGAIPPLVQLLGPGHHTTVQQLAAAALAELGDSNDENRAAITAEAASAGLMQEMERLGINDGPAGVPA